MKKIVSAVLLVCILATSGLISPITSGAAAPSLICFDSEASVGLLGHIASSVLRGDLTGEGIINSLDLLQLKLYFVGKLTDINIDCADVDRSGVCNARDSLTLRKILCGMLPTPVEDTTVSREYDSSKAAKFAVTKAKTTAAYAELDYSASSITAADYTHAVIICMLPCENSAQSPSASLKFTMSDGVTGNIPVTLSPTGKYASVIADLSAITAWSGTLKSLRFEFFNAPVLGDVIYLDSVIFCANQTDAKNQADARIAARTVSDDPTGIADDQVFDDRFIVRFDAEKKLGALTYVNNSSCTYDPAEDAAKLTLTGTGLDPHAYLDLSRYNLSADEYKYIVYACRIPNNNKLGSPQGELFFCAGNITEPTANYSEIFNMTRDGNYYAYPIDMTTKSYWTGTIHGLRLDYFCGAAVGDVSYIDTVTFCKTVAARDAVVNKYTAKMTWDPGVFQHFWDMDIPYRLHVPEEYDPSRKYPVFIYLHGAGERGSDNTCQLSVGIIQLFKNCRSPIYDSIVIAPQCPSGQQWVDTPWAMGSYDSNYIKESDELTAVMEVLYKVMDEYSCDPDRVYVSGMSMGGFGTWDLLMRHSDVFAAGIPICGGADPSKAAILKDIPIRTFHGSVDNIVPVRGTREISTAINALSPRDFLYTEIAGADHFIWDQVYNTEGLIKWLYMQRLSDRK